MYRIRKKVLPLIVLPIALLPVSCKSSDRDHRQFHDSTALISIDRLPSEIAKDWKKKRMMLASLSFMT